MGNCISRPDCDNTARAFYSDQQSRINSRQQSRRRRHSSLSSRLMMKLSFSHRRRYSLKETSRFSLSDSQQFNRLEQHLIVECFHGNYNAVIRIVDSGEDVDKRDAYGETPLTVACAKGHYDIAELLIEEEANVNKQNKEGWSPLMIASQNGHFAIVESLAKHRAFEVDTTNQYGVTSLMLASENGHGRIVEFLIEMRADINMQDNDGACALILASGKGHKEIVTLLVERGADKCKHNNRGETAMDIAKRKQHQQKGIERILSGKLRESYQDIPHAASVDQIAAEVGLSTKLLDQPFSEDLKVRIGQLIPNWLEYAEPLKLTQQEINGINTNPQFNFSLKTQELLATWYRKCAYTEWSHYRILVKVSCELGLADVAGKICEVLKENSVLPLTDDPTVLYISRDLKLYKKASIGGGVFGSVFKGELNGKPCALKILHFLASEILMCLPTAVLANSESVDRFQQECEYLKSFKHPNIVQHLATETHPKTGHLVLVLELLDCNLRQYFSAVKEITIATQTSLCHNIISALAEIHCRQIVHRDLCADNILLDTKESVPVAKVSDFGMSKIIQTKVQSLSLPVFGHRGYLPPEADTDSSRCDSSFDIFQFGVLMLQIVRCLPSVKSKQERINELEKVDPAHPLKNTIEQCLLEDSFKRPSANELQRQLPSIS